MLVCKQNKISDPSQFLMVFGDKDRRLTDGFLEKRGAHADWLKGYEKTPGIY